MLVGVGACLDVALKCGTHFSAIDACFTKHAVFLGYQVHILVTRDGNNQIIPNAVHDVRWITNDGRPNGGYLQIFNNSGMSNNQSTIDGIKTPLDPLTYTYLRNPGQAFTPISYTTSRSQ